MFGRLGAGPAAAIFAAFADPEPVVYSQRGVALPAPVRAVRSVDAAPAFAGPGDTLRSTTYEIRQADLPDEPTAKDSFTHRGRRWRVSNVTRDDDAGAWLLMVTDAGAA